ncbi:uncharacterized protein LOC110848756 [Folsomia candida]|uniref:uncharacterized protein LOC110848756 n=1 Tax=Folsomia candida TaxID=158441 RepID=UPI000B8F48C3|nr:uncharacterized protein LOC110848756 [Folsomia candida]
MKFLVVLVAVVAYAHLGNCGVGVLTPAIEAEALRLWHSYCNGASEGGTDGSTFIYCKRSNENYEESLQHNVELPRGQEQGQQVVFVQPPSYHYKHDVIVSGGGGSAPKTVIYVKPAKNTNEVNIVDQTRPNAAPQKPTLFFLKGGHGGESQTQVAAQPQQPQPTQSGYNYPPPTQNGYNYPTPRPTPQSGYNYNAPQRGLRY